MSAARISLLAGLALAACAVGAPAALAQHHHGPSMESGRPRGDSIYELSATLVDQDGMRVGLDQFRGHPVLISMFYASCRDTCPLLIAEIQRIDAELPPPVRADLRIALVSVDPDRDTPRVLQAFARSRHVDESRWRFLSAPDDTVREIAAALGQKYRRLSDGSFNHSSLITLLDASGAILTRVEGTGKPHQELVERLLATRPASGR
jgi:protein SCO1